MKILMLGWEFPPFFAGGAGIVCSELSKALNELGSKVTFIMPKGPSDKLEKLNKNNSLLKIKVPKQTMDLSKKKVSSLLKPYMGWEEYDELYKDYLQKTGNKDLYGKDLKAEVERFSDLILQFKDEDFDVIHAHDWVTFLAGVKLKQITKKPLVVHVHITEFDKSGGLYADPYIYNIEKFGMLQADKIITVSYKIKEACVSHYGINQDKIEVVHNAATSMKDINIRKAPVKTVLFAGRITTQKGPQYFVEAAKKVLQIIQDVRFVMAGTGDLLPKMIDKVKNLGLEDKFVFTGFFTRDEAEHIFGSANVFVMPSVSEPFGLVPFESQLKRTPTIISKQSGISEVLKHALKVDFWDVDEMANKILALLHYTDLNEELSDKGFEEAKNNTWQLPASKCLKIYKSVIRGAI